MESGSCGQGRLQFLRAFAQKQMIERAPAFIKQIVINRDAGKAFKYVVND